MHQSDRSTLHFVEDCLHGKSRLHSESSIGIDGQSGPLLIDLAPGLTTGLTGNSADVWLVGIPAIGIVTTVASITTSTTSAIATSTPLALVLPFALTLLLSFFLWRREVLPHWHRSSK